jgi:hypothetical protein
MADAGNWKLQLLMDDSPSQDENQAISTFSRVLYTTKATKYGETAETSATGADSDVRHA